MDLTITRGSDHNEGATSAVVAVSGELDSDTAPQLEAVFASLRTEGVSDLVVNLAHTSFVSSAGLSVLVGGKKTFHDFGIERGNRVVDRLISLTGLSELYTGYWRSDAHSREADTTIRH